MANLKNPEMNDLHSSKILLCYLMNRLNRRVSEEQLHEIAMESGVIDHFYYSGALDELLGTGAFIRSTDGGTAYISIGEKGRLGAEFFDMSVPAPFRKRILEAAYSFFSEIRRNNECSSEIICSDNGAVLKFSIGDSSLELMKAEIYAPDEEQARFIEERLRRNPTHFYRCFIDTLLKNPEDKPDIRI